MSSLSVSTWMDRVANPSNLMSHLSIPGTHETCAISSIPYVGCQELSISEQADRGIRFFDFRLNFRSVTKWVLMLVHEFYSLDLAFENALDELYKWIDNHLSEAFVIQIKLDGNLPAGLTPTDFCDEVFKVLRQSTTSKYWRLATDIPNLIDLKGKIQLVRRFQLSSSQPIASSGLDVNVWKNNSSVPFDIKATPGSSIKNIRVQDKYNYVPAEGSLRITVPKKFALVQNLMQEAASNSKPDVWYFNYASAYTIEIPGVNPGQPYDFAQGWWDDDFHEYIDGVNHHIQKFLRTSPGVARYGVIMMDYPTGKYSADLVADIIRTNNLNP